MRKGEPVVNNKSTGTAGSVATDISALFNIKGGTARTLMMICFIVPYVIWGIAQLLNILSYGRSLASVDIFSLLCLGTASAAFMRGREKLAVAFTGFFWMQIFVYSYFGVVNKNWGIILGILMDVLFVVYVFIAAYPLHSKSLFKKISFPVKMITYIAILILMLLGVIFFFVNIKANYYRISSLILIIGSVIMLYTLSGDFNKTVWMRPVKKIGIPLTVLFLVIFGIIDGILQLVVFKKNSTVPGGLLFISPILWNLFVISGIIPVFLYIVNGVKYYVNNEKHTADRVDRREAPVSNSDENLNEGTEQDIHPVNSKEYAESIARRYQQQREEEIKETPEAQINANPWGDPESDYSSYTGVPMGEEQSKEIPEVPDYLNDGEPVTATYSPSSGKMTYSKSFSEAEEKIFNDMNPNNSSSYSADSYYEDAQVREKILREHRANVAGLGNFDADVKPPHISHVNTNGESTLSNQPVNGNNDQNPPAPPIPRRV